MNTEYLKGYRTVAANILSLIVVVLGALTGQITDPGTLQIIAAALAVGNVLLRFLTTTPVGKVSV